MRAAVNAGLIASSPCERQPLPASSARKCGSSVRTSWPRWRASWTSGTGRWSSSAATAASGLASYSACVGAVSTFYAAESTSPKRSWRSAGTTILDHRRHGPGDGRCRCPASWWTFLPEHVAGLEPGDLVFPAPDGGPVRASLFRRRFWYPACVAAGLGELEKDAKGQEHYSGLRLHDLRHSAVTLWIAAGASAKEVAVRAGHTSVSVVLDRYGHLLPGTEERVTDALDAMAIAAFVAPKPATVSTIR